MPLSLGKRSKAQTILRGLRELKEVRDNPELLSDIYATFASPAMEESARERVRLLKLAIGSLNEDSPRMVHRYRALTIGLLSLGKLAEAEVALRRVESYCFSDEDRQKVEDVRASVLMAQGNFAAAARSFSSRRFLLAVPGAISLNLAVCLEQLGDLRKARELQETAKREAEASGHVFAQMVSLSNLGALETKLGNMAAAETVFAAVRAKLRVLQTQGEVSITRFTSSLADMAAFSIQKGDFRTAAIDLGRIDMNRAGPFPAELFLRCHDPMRVIWRWDSGSAQRQP